MHHEQVDLPELVDDDDDWPDAPVADYYLGIMAHQVLTPADAPVPTFTPPGHKDALPELVADEEVPEPPPHYPRADLRTINELTIFSTHGCTLFMDWMLVIPHPNLCGTDNDIHCLMMQLRDLSEYRNINPCDARRPRGYGLRRRVATSYSSMTAARARRPPPRKQV
jgi:hypothetical protein